MDNDHNPRQLFLNAVALEIVSISTVYTAGNYLLSLLLR
jgi:hypothetical protein